jgi:chemotaxis response regulator CheB
MKTHPDIVAIGASSGGIEALQSILEELADIDAIVLVVLHRPANREIIRLTGTVPAKRLASSR